MPCAAWLPTGVLASWARYRWPLRSATGGGSPTRRRSWPSPGWCPANAPQATASGVATSPAPAANIYASSWWSQPGRIITAPDRRRPPRAPATGRPRHPGSLLGGAAAAVPPVPAAGAPQTHQGCGRGRGRPGARRVPVGRDADLTCMQPIVGGSPIGATAPPAPGPVGAPPCRNDPRDFIAAPTPARRNKGGATACAQPTCGPDPRTSEWRSRRSTPLRRGPGQPPPGRLPSPA